jgi:hypothetical protein
MDTMDGNVEFELEHIEGADLVVTLTYASAKSLLGDGDATSAMQDFTSGKIKGRGGRDEGARPGSDADGPTDARGSGTRPRDHCFLRRSR